MHTTHHCKCFTWENIVSDWPIDEFVNEFSGKTENSRKQILFYVEQF